MPKKQAIYIVRYGLRACDLIEELGPFDMDISLSGVAHAHLISGGILSDFNSNNDDNNGDIDDDDYDEIEEIGCIYSSNFLRSAHTSHILSQTSSLAPSLSHSLSQSDCVRIPVYIEEGLTEWLSTGLVGKDNYKPRTAGELKEMGFDCIDVGYESVNKTTESNNNDTRSCDVSPMFPENEENLLRRCHTTIKRILSNENSKGYGKSIVIVSHAPVNQGVALSLEGLLSPGSGLNMEKSSMYGKLWCLGGVSKFVREKGEKNEWKCKAVGDTSHMPMEGGYRGGMSGWSLPCLIGLQKRKAEEGGQE